MTRLDPEIIPFPGEKLDAAKMPGHWLVARLGKKVLRPGGLRATQAMLDALAITDRESVVEFAPGLGGTARLILASSPRSYVGLERDKDAAAFARRHLADSPVAKIRVGTADRTGLLTASTNVVVGEAMLTMNPDKHKAEIAAEAFRILKSGGRYGIHELKVTPDNIAPQKHAEIDKALSSEIHVGARPLPSAGWRQLLESVGFEIEFEAEAPMHLLRARRMIADEGTLGALNIAKNMVLNPLARRRVFAMRRVFETYRDNIAAVYLIARKPT